MGCSHSDLKGEKPADIAEDKPQPIKKVQTNFSTVDYDVSTKSRRDTEYGPHDTVRQQSVALPSSTQKGSDPISVAGIDTATDPAQPRGTSKATGNDKHPFENKIRDSNAQDPLSRDVEEQKAPYKDIDDSGIPSLPTHIKNDDQVHQSQPHFQTSEQQGLKYSDEISISDHQRSEKVDNNMGIFSKNKKSSIPEDQKPITNDNTSTHPATQKPDSYLTADIPSSSSKYDTPIEKEQFFTSQASTSSIGEGSVQDASDQPKKKSLYQKYQDRKRGPGTSGLSDEDYKKYTGMDRAQMEEYAKTTPGVAGGQRAGSLTAGGTSGIGLTGAADGLGGWGHNSQKDTVIR